MILGGIRFFTNFLQDFCNKRQNPFSIPSYHVSAIQKIVYRGYYLCGRV